MAEILFEDPADAEDESAKLSVLVQDIIAGGIAGSAGIFAGHPLDTLKVRLQLPSSKNQGVPKGHSGLFRGLAAPLSTAALVNATSFTTVRLSCRIWDEGARRELRGGGEAVERGKFRRIVIGVSKLCRIFTYSCTLDGR